MAYEIYDEEIVMGRQSPWAGAQDLRLAGGKLQTRGLFVHEIGNPGQINLARFGPDNVDYNFFPPQKVSMDQPLGHISFSGYEGVDAGMGPRAAQIHSRYRGPGEGTLTLVTSGQDRITIDEDGRLDLSGISEDGDVPVIVNGRKGRLVIRWD